MTAARLLVGDVFDRMAELEDGSVDLILTSPPFLALRKYLPEGHPDADKEIGQETTPAAFLDTMLALTAVWRRLLAPHGSIAVEIGDTYSGSGGGGGDYQADGLRAGQPTFDGSGKRIRETRREGYIANGVTPPARRDITVGWPLPKSLAMIPELYAASLAYGRNLLTGEPSPAGMWRVRNIKPWIRSNPPVGALGDKERPATSYVTVATVAVDRYFDLDAVRTVGARIDETPRITKDPKRADGWGRASGPATQNPAGAPPLDWWHHVDAVIDAEIDRRAGQQSKRPGDIGAKRRHVKPEFGDMADYVGPVTGARGVHIRRALEKAGILTTHDALDVSPKGYSGMTRPTTRLVPCGPHDGGLRTTSRGCPVHGDRPAPAPTAPDDAHAENPETRTPHNGDHPALEPLPGFAPTAPHSEPVTEDASSDSPHLPCAPAATPHSTAASRTDPAPATTPPDSASDRSPARTGDTSASPQSGEPRPDTPANRTGEDDQPSREHETDARTADTSDPLAACTCSYHFAVKDDESTSHYAVWPPELCRLLIDEMCPRRVCTVCGEPSRRIVEVEHQTGETSPSRGKGQGSPDRGVDMARVHSTVMRTVGWSDCACPGDDRWRPGHVLDPFAGSGTTLAVCTGMARTATGIDIDESNAALAIERCGMFLEVDHGDTKEATA